jgi:hypothetical protein
MRILKVVVAGQIVYFRAVTWFDARRMGETLFNKEPATLWTQMQTVESYEPEEGSRLFYRNKAGAIIEELKAPPVKSTKKGHRNGR